MQRQKQKLAEAGWQKQGSAFLSSCLLAFLRFSDATPAQACRELAVWQRDTIGQQDGDEGLPKHLWKRNWI